MHCTFIFQGNFLRIAHLWEGYPHIVLDWNTKLFLISQVRTYFDYIITNA